MTATKGRACAGKIAHAARIAADEHLARLVREGGAAEDAYNVYWCRNCSSWHGGHRSPRRRGRRS